jgi:hypothetical protein
MSSHNQVLDTEQVHIYPDGRMDSKNSAKYVGLSVCQRQLKIDPFTVYSAT